MAGEARSDNFMLGTATIMVGAQADLLALTPDLHSIGLVKNVKFMTDPKFVDLTQGTQNTLVYSMMNGNDVTIEADMFEYTPRNLAYAASLDGSSLVQSTVSAAVATAYAAPTGQNQLGLLPLILDSVVGITVGDHVMVQPSGLKDNVHPRRVTAVDAGTKTVTLAQGLPQAVTVGSRVFVSRMIGLGSGDDQPFLSAKMVGTLANGKTIALLIPKVRWGSGVSVSFKTDNFEAMPVSLKIFDLIPGDANYADFATASPKGGPLKAKLLV